MNKYIPAILGIILIALLAQAQSTAKGAAILDSNAVVLNLTPKQLLMYLPSVAVGIWLIYKNIERLLPIFVIALVIFIAFTMSGCAGVAESIVDPTGYTQRSQSQSDAQRAFAESQKALAESEAERSRSEARRAEAEAQTAQAQAQGQAAQAQAQAEFATAATNAVKEAAAQNKGVLIFAIALIAGMAAWMIYNNTKIVVAVTSSPAYQQQQSVMLPPPTPAHIIGAPPAVQMIADRKGLRPQFDGERWLLVDDEGVVRERQRLISG